MCTSLLATCLLQTGADTVATALQGYKKPAPMSVQHNYHITSQVPTAQSTRHLLHAAFTNALFLELGWRPCTR